MLLMKPELLDGIDTEEGLKEVLQTAIELEHSTIPPYLYSLYSLMPSGNVEIAELVSSVVAEEMAHMALACNLLNAIGGEPVIDKPGFLPTYPGSLPGTVDRELVVHLEPFSLTQVRETFMVIEEPEQRVPIPELAAVEAVHVTIGGFYEAIRKQLETAGEQIFAAGRKGYQVSGGIALDEVIEVTNLASAVEAIHTIVEQGEGTSTSPLGDDAGDEFAHFYRFAEIANGRKLKAAPGEEPPWRYDGEPIPFEAKSVYPIVKDPSSAGYPAGSAARYACDTFNYTYTSLLKALHETFNGNPANLNTAVGLMESLNEQAQTMVRIPSGSGENAGPSFEYRPTNP
jgi:hypothetical protein